MSRRSHGSRVRRVVGAALAVATLTPAENVVDSTAPETSAVSSGVDQDELDLDATLRFTHSAEPTHFDPHSQTPPTSLAYLWPLYDRLANVNESGTAVPMLATSWEADEDRMSWTIELRDDAFFHDGSPVDAAAVKANLDRYQELGVVTVPLESVNSVEVVDDFTLRLLLSEPSNFIPLSLTQMFIASPDAFDRLEVEPVGSGPYRFVSANASGAVYERAENYWEPEAQLVARLEISGIPDSTAKINAVASGQVDAAALSAAEYEQASEYVAVTEGLFIPENFPAPNSIWGMTLNTASPHLADVRVRYALSVAADRNGMSEAITGGACPPWVQPFSTTVVGYDPRIDEEWNFDGDLELAREILADAGAGDFTIRVLMADHATSRGFTEALQAQYAQLGVTFDITTQTTAATREEWLTGNYDAAVITSVRSTDPHFVMELNYTGSTNFGPIPDELAELVELGADQPLDSPERQETYQRISRHLVDNPIQIGMCLNVPQWLVHDYVVGIDRMYGSMVNGLVPDVRYVGILEH